MLTSSHLLVFLASHLHTSSHSLTHLHTSSLSLSPSLSLALCHGLSPSFLFSLKAAGSADEAPQYDTLSREMRFECQKSKADEISRFHNFRGNPFARNELRVSKTDVFLQVWLVRRQPFRTKWCLSVKNLWFCAILHPWRQSIRAKLGSSVKNWWFFRLLGWSGGNPFARNKVRVSKTDGFLRLWLVRR